MNESAKSLGIYRKTLQIAFLFQERIHIIFGEQKLRPPSAILLVTICMFCQAREGLRSVDVRTKQKAPSFSVVCAMEKLLVCQ